MPLDRDRTAWLGSQEMLPSINSDVYQTWETHPGAVQGYKVEKRLKHFPHPSVLAQWQLQFNL